MTTTTTRLSTSPRCPVCNTLLNAATASGANPEARPAEGDVTICVRCTAALFYVGTGRSLTLRLPTDDELAELQRDPAIARQKAHVIKLSRDPVNGWELK